MPSKQDPPDTEHNTARKTQKWQSPGRAAGIGKCLGFKVKEGTEDTSSPGEEIQRCRKEEKLCELDWIPKDAS